LTHLATALAAAEIPVGVGGSRAMRASRAESDYDLVIYGRDNVERAAKVIASLEGYRQELHFSMDSVRAKYRHFTRLTAEDLELLVVDRWRHFRLHGVPISVDGADPVLAGDPWVNAPAQTFDSVHVRGAVLDGSQCYTSPKILDLQTDNGVVRVFTWLNLYAGALRTGDEAAVYGRWMVSRGQQFLLVQDSTHAIRVVARNSTCLV
jgi:predicted nucleotidyltransferase